MKPALFIVSSGLLLTPCLTAQRAGRQSVPVFGTTVVRAIGFKGDIYHLRDQTRRLPDFAKLTSSGSIYAAELNVPAQDFEEGFPGVTDRFEWFAIDYQGRFWITRQGQYAFLLTSDDGARLYIDGKQVINNDGEHPTRSRRGRLDLKPGSHRIRVSYFQGPRFHVALELHVAGPGEPFRVFNMDEFCPPAALEESAAKTPSARDSPRR